jgi:FMN phosphatase YigB (HAD superfamily)
VVYPDTVPVLRALNDAGVPVAVVSNIPFDVRPLAAILSFGDLIHAYGLSCEVGAVKPEETIFAAALHAVGVCPERALMVGDTPADAGAVRLGCRCLLQPASPPGSPNNLDAVLRAVLGDPAPRNHTPSRYATISTSR